MSEPAQHSSIDPNHLLQEGIAAIQSGDRVHGRDMLVEAVELDPSLETAWWWLSEVVDSLEDQVVALENILTLNPDNAAARERLAAAKAELEGPPPVPDEDDVTYSPYQCVYCGELTAPDDRRCPHCRHNLMKASGAKRSGCLNITLLILVGWNTQAAVLLAFIPFLARSAHTGYVLQLGRFRFMQALFTDFLNWPSTVVPTLVALGLVHVGLLLLLVLGLLTDSEWIYAATLIVVPLDILLLGLGLWQGYVSPIFFGLHTALGSGQAALIVISNFQLASKRVRELLEIKKGKYLPVELYRLGHQHRRQGKWALATLAWQMAAVRKPDPAYFYQLGIGYAHLNRHTRALRALREAQRLAPDNAQIAEAAATIEKRTGVRPNAAAGTERRQ